MIDQGVTKGQPAEVRVSVALGVQAHCKSWTTGRRRVRATLMGGGGYSGVFPDPRQDPGPLASCSEGRAGNLR